MLTKAQLLADMRERRRRKQIEDDAVQEDVARIEALQKARREAEVVRDKDKGS